MPDVRGSVDRLAASHGTMSNADFKLFEQAAGCNHEPNARLSVTALKEVVQPSSQYMHDRMHAIMVSGVVHMLLYLVFGALVTNGMADVYYRMQEYCGKWS